MLTPSSDHVHLQRPLTENLRNETSLLPQPRNSLHRRDTRCRTHIRNRRRRSGRISRENIAHEAPGCQNVTPRYYEPSNWCRDNSIPTILPGSRCNMTKHQEDHVEHPMPMCPQTHPQEDVSMHTDASLSYTSEPASVSSSEGESTHTSISHPAPDTNADPADCGPVTRAEDSVNPTNQAPPSDRTQHDIETDVVTTGLFEDAEQGAAAAASRIHPDTEYHANLFAAPEDSRYLFEEFYKNTYGEIATETDNESDAYWKWDKKRHDWFHENPDTHSVVWFWG